MDGETQMSPDQYRKLSLESRRAGGAMVVSPALQCGEGKVIAVESRRDGASHDRTPSRRCLAPSLRDSRFLQHRNPALKCGANYHCASGALACSAPSPVLPQNHSDFPGNRSSEPEILKEPEKLSVRHSTRLLEIGNWKPETSCSGCSV